MVCARNMSGEAPSGMVTPGSIAGLNSSPGEWTSCLPGRVLRPVGAKHGSLGDGSGEGESLGSPRHQRRNLCGRPGVGAALGPGFRSQVHVSHPNTNLAWEV